MIVNPYNPLQSRYSGSSSANITFGHGLKETATDDGIRVVSIDMVENLNGDNTLPMSAAGVDLILGNIGALLATV